MNRFVTSRSRVLAGRWLVALALLGALAPTVSRALASTARSGWIEVCGAAGVRWVAVTPAVGDEPSHAPGISMASDACALCSLGLDRVWPEAEPGVDLRDRDPAPRPASGHRAPSTVWACAPPGATGPPSRS